MKVAEIILTLSNIEYRDFKFSIEAIDADTFTVCINRVETDHVSGELKLFQGRRWFVHSDMDKSDLVRTCFAAVLAWQEHEIREEFTYKGADIFNPHFDVDVLADEWS